MVSQQELGRLRSWTSHLTAEEKMRKISTIDLLDRYFYWTFDFTRFIDTYTAGSSSLTFLVGLQGSGKTNALWMLCKKLNESSRAAYIRWGEIYPKPWDEEKTEHLLIDLPDYMAGNLRAMRSC